MNEYRLTPRGAFVLNVYYNVKAILAWVAVVTISLWLAILIAFMFAMWFTI